MAEGGDDIMVITDEQTTPGPSSGPINTPEVQEYRDVIEKIFNDFKELLKEDQKDVLVVTVQTLKRHMVKSWDQMAAAKVNAVMRTIHEPTCVTLCQSLEEGRVTVVDPDKDMPTGQQVLLKLPLQKSAMKDHVITLFDSLSVATDHLSTAFANLSSLVKICNKETFRIILTGSACSLVQINILENFLNPVAMLVPSKEGEEQLKKICASLLPRPSAPVLI